MFFRFPGSSQEEGAGNNFAEDNEEDLYS